MAFLILFIGLAIFGFNLFNWRKLTKIASKSNAHPKPSLVINYATHLWLEWKRYALGDLSLKGMKGAMVALVLLLVLLFLNANWLQFDVMFFLPMTLMVMFIAQLRIGRSLHRRYFEDRFPEILSVVNAAVSAGNSIHQALHRCGEGIDGDLGVTFHRIDRRLNLGEDPERVFNDAWQNYRYREFYFFVVVMLVSLQHGGQLRTLIGRLSRIVNNSKNMARRKSAMTSEARTSAKIVASLPLLFFCGMKYFSPENFDFVVHDPVGRLILYYVIASEAIGMIIIWILLRRAL